MSMEIEVPRAVCEMVEHLEKAGFETWTVGGAVRDAVRGSPGEREDWDLATRAHPGQVRRLFARTVPLGVEYGTVGVFGSDGVMYEVTTFRHDVITYGRKAVVAFAESLQDDLARRDFTVNAMAWHPGERRLCDPHGGRRDLDRGILRAVGTPSERFREDYLRVLRGLRFAGALGFQVEPETWAGMIEAAPGIARLSVERIREELMKVLAGPRPSRALELYQRCGAMEHVFPEIGRPFADDALAAVDAVKGGDPDVRLTMLLLHGLGVAAPLSAVSGLLVRLRFSNSKVERIRSMFSGGLRPLKVVVHDAAARRRWMARTGKAALPGVFRVWRAVARIDADREVAVEPAIAAIEHDVDQAVPLSIQELALAGRDLVALGWRPGPDIGRALRQLLEAVWEDSVPNDRARLIEMAERMGPAGGT